MAVGIIESGTIVRIECTIKTENGLPYNPAGLSFTILVPGDTSPTIIYYEKPEATGHGIIHYKKYEDLSKITGTFYIDWLTTTAGIYNYVFTAYGDLFVSQRGTFTVQKLF